ncbi:MAG: FHA domain-containing protein, partial [Akkermansiaceae bacterium]|nr:FHA domain-containing protein [Armatimonadota bacterium]
ILGAMEDGRREGLDGQVYVPNAYTLRIAVASDAERDYLRAFLSAEELATAVARTIAQHGYRTRGALLFVIEEADTGDPNAERVQVICRFDVSVQKKDKESGGQEPVKGSDAIARTKPEVRTPPLPASLPVSSPSDEEPGTVPAAFGPGGAVLATLLVRSGEGRSLEAFPLGPRVTTIGRSRQAGNDVVVNDSQVSKKHGRIAWEGGAFVYYDENSTNGSRLNEAPLAPNVAHPLNFGDVIRLGETTLTLRPASNVATAAQPIVPPKPPSGGNMGASLVSANGEVQRLASEMSAGRSVTADFAITGGNISDKHARLKISDVGKLTVEDLNTPGGTQVNGERIPPLYPITLRDGDSVIFGTGSPYTVRIG